VHDAFYFDKDDCKGMVLGQSRVATLQALRGLAQGVRIRAPESPPVQA
jgi:hypothetical protein